MINPDGSYGGGGADPLPIKILHVEDSVKDAELVRALLTQEWPNCAIKLIASSPDFVTSLEGDAYDLILSDFPVGPFGGLDALKLAREKRPGTPFIFLAVTLGEERAIEAVKAGAQDYVVKERLNYLITAIRRALGEMQERAQRQRTEQALHRFASVVEATPDFIGMASLDGKMFYLNLAGRRLLGLEPNLDPGLLSVTDFYPPEMSERILREHIPAAKRNGVWVGETTLRARDGRLIPVSQILLLHPAALGGEAYLSTIMRDLTAERGAQLRIREQADLLNKARDAIIVTDLDGLVTFWNEGAEHISGRSSAEAMGRPLGVVLGLDSETEIDAARRALEVADVWRGEFPLESKDGKRLVMDISATLVRDDRGRPKARLSIGTDVTAKRSLEERFLRAQRLESIGMLATGISHDLNNVLAPILMVAPMLREHATLPADLRMIEILEKSAERGAGLVRQILAFAHGASAQHRLVQVKHLVRDISGIIRETFPKNIELEELVPNDLWPINANPTQIHQVLLNLCVNGRDAMPGGGKLFLRAENSLLDERAAGLIPGARAGTWLVLHVEDTGTGILPAVLERIWEPFFTTKAADKGTGLGLSTVRGIVEEHQGFITVVSVPGVGTTFRVHLPAAELTSEGAPAGTLHPFAIRGNGELILVVDDETRIREATGATLAHFGYRVLVAEDGIEALALFAARGTEISLVVTDLSMPNLDGTALAKVVLRINPKTKILVVSGLAAGALNADLQRLPGTFLLKPFKADALLEAVHKLLHPATLDLG